MKKIILLLCLCLVFISCSKDDKTIEKIIYGDKITYGDNPTILDKNKFNQVSVSKSFNNTNDFISYMKQCFNNRTNLLGKKFKVKGIFNIRQSDFVAIDEKHYFFFRTSIEDIDSSPKVISIIKFVSSNSNTNPPEQINEITFIVTKNEGSYYEDNKQITLEGYSYDL